MTYAYYYLTSNGEFVASSKNVITTNGYLMINKYLANSAQDWAGGFAIGVLSRNTASATDTDLEYEIGRYPITLKSYRTISGSNQLVVKATIDPILSASITEVGLFPALDVSKNNYMLSDFSESSGSVNLWTASGSTSSLQFAPYSRYGANNSYWFASNSFITNTNLNFNMSQYTSIDSADLLVYTPATSSATFRIVFGDTNGNIWTSASGSGSISGAGWYRIRMPLTASYSSTFNYLINSVSINFLTTANASIHFDALKLISGDVKPETLKLTSRSLFSTPVAKNANQPMQMEYYVQVT
ncbi:MAG: hypothetical protein EB127_03265 [Alphaproteobacteria bacterium]|nr:hypothetical protein [Alphaproteobacteria bacterium]